MAEVLAVPETADDEQQLQIVAKCMSFVPKNIDIKEGYSLMTILYKVGILDAYLAAVEGRFWHGEFRHYFDFQDERTIKIQEGRIEFLCLLVRNWSSRSDDELRFNLPPIIDELRNLTSIELRNCNLIPLEISNLLHLKTIHFRKCTQNMFENIPDGLQLPSITKLTISNMPVFRPASNLSSFIKIFSDNLEELCFENVTREQSDEILRLLQDNGDSINFRHSLKVLVMQNCKLKERDLERLLYEIQPLFPNLHTMDVWNNGIRSLRGIEDRTKQMMTSSSSNNLRRLNLGRNPVLNHATIRDDVNSHDDRSPNTARDPMEKVALLTLLDTFKGISNIGHCLKMNLGRHVRVYQYDPEIEYVLRINQAGRKFMLETTGGTGVIGVNNGNRTKPITNQALWPLILEKAYKNSAEIYDHDGRRISKKVAESKMCSTGLFHMIRNYAYGPIFVEDHSRVTNITTVTLLSPVTTIATRVKLRRRHRDHR